MKPDHCYTLTHATKHVTVGLIAIKKTLYYATTSLNSISLVHV